MPVCAWGEMRASVDRLVWVIREADNVYRSCIAGLSSARSAQPSVRVLFAHPIAHFLFPSCVSPTQEESGGYFDDVISAFESHDMVGQTLPWGPMSIFKDMKPSESDDGV